MNTIFKYILLGVIGIALSSSAMAQRNVRIGDKYFKKFDFITATEFYKKAVDKNEDKVKAVEKLALSYKHLNDVDQTAFWYGKLVELQNDSALHKFSYAQALRGNQRYDEALAQYNEYMTGQNKDFVSNITGSGFDYIDGLKTPNPSIEVKNASALNSQESDFGVSFKDLGLITYCSTRPKSNGDQDNWTHNKYTDLYEANVSFEDQEAPNKFANDKYNGIYHDGPAFFDGDVMYLTRSNYVKRRLKKSKSDKTVKLQLHEVDLNSPKGSVKKYSEKLVFNDKNYSVGHATISPDGKTMIFSSDSEEFKLNQGGTDLYYCTREDSTGDWGEPKSLGNIINTPADEEYPYFADNSTLYFASDGHYGLGGLDMYSSTMSGDSWSTPINLGAPLNSSYDDFNYVYNSGEEFGLFTSNRPGGKGSDDIYTFRYTDGENISGTGPILKILAYDANTLEPLEEVVIEIPQCLEDELTTDASGKSTTRIDSYSKCKLSAELEGYFPRDIPFSVFDEDVTVEVPLHKQDNKNEIQLQVCVYDRKTLQAIPGTNVKVFSELEGKFVSATTDEEGCTIFDNIYPDNCYGLVGSKEVNIPDQKYLTTTDEVCTEGVEAPALVQKALYLDYVTLGQPIVGSLDGRVTPDGVVLPIIYYDLDKFNIRVDAARELNELVKIMKDNPTLHIEAASHTDCRRDEAYNMKLSKNRAIEAIDYVVEKGIDRNRLTWGAYGENEHVNDCDCECYGDVNQMGLRPFRDCEDLQIQDCNEDDHQQNRRTEFVIKKL